MRKLRDCVVLFLVVRNTSGLDRNSVFLSSPFRFTRGVTVSSLFLQRHTNLEPSRICFFNRRKVKRTATAAHPVATKPTAPTTSHGDDENDHEPPIPSPSGSSEGSGTNEHLRNYLIGWGILGGFYLLSKYVEKQRNPCAGVDCGAHGDCKNGECRCKDSWTGKNCEIPPGRRVFSCRLRTHGTCIGGQGCICDPGWGRRQVRPKGSRRSMHIRFAMRPAWHSQTRRRHVFLRLPEGFTGERCEIPPEEEQDEEKKDDERAANIWRPLNVKAVSVGYGHSAFLTRVDANGDVFVSVDNAVSWEKKGSNASMVSAGSDGTLAMVSRQGGAVVVRWQRESLEQTARK